MTLFGLPPSAIVLEMIYKGICSLYTRISELTNLFAVEVIPTPTIKFLIELADEFGVDKVHKSISDITLIVVVHWQIKKIDF